jgi:hypothetical protein
MDAKEYFKKEYDKDHINLVVNLNDIESLYGLMDEFAQHEVKKTPPANAKKNKRPGKHL